MAKLRFTQHLPGFVSGFDPIKLKASSIEELLKNELFIDISSEDDFYRWSWSQNGSQVLLMAELNGGSKWRVIGYLSYVPNELPKWSPPVKE